MAIRAAHAPDLDWSIHTIPLQQFTARSRQHRGTGAREDTHCRKVFELFLIVIPAEMCGAR